MGGGEHHRGWGGSAEPPTSAVAPETTYAQREDRWTHFDDSVNAVSFGFVATAILISMFLLMAIFERFLRSRTTSSSSSASPPPPPTPSGPSPGRSVTRSDVESQMALPQKLHLLSSPKMSLYANGVSVLMPGEQRPTFLAHPAPPPPRNLPPPPPPPCPREPISQLPHQQSNHSLHLHCLPRSIGS